MRLNAFLDEHLVRIPRIRSLVKTLFCSLNSHGRSAHVRHGGGLTVIVRDNRVYGVHDPRSLALWILVLGVRGLLRRGIPAPGPSKVAVICIRLRLAVSFSHPLQFCL